MNLADVLIFLSFFKIPIIQGECLKEEWRAQYIDSVITICREDVDVGTIIHEGGHAYKDKVMTEKQRKLWDKLSSSCTKEECFVSKYAMTNSEEDFAETFRIV